MTLRSLRPSSISSRYATRLAVALTLGCAVSAPAYALRLAHSRIVSAPDAPLQVLVGIADLTPDEQRTLMATLADPSAWQQAGVTPPVPLSSITLRLEGSGSPTRRNLRISSPEAAKGPVVDLLLNLGTSEGQRQVQVSMMQSAGGFPGLTSQAQVGGGTRAARGAGAVAVRPGDTLYGIAQSNAVADATIYQMLVALWRANPNAFIQNNMNLVKAGVTLVVPDAATVRAVDPAEARRIFLQQQEAYARYRASLAGAAARGAAASAGSTSAGQVGGPQSAATSETPPQDRLRLSSGQPGQGGADAQAQAQADAQTSVAKATEDAQQRVDQLERNVKELNSALAAQGKGGAAQGSSGGAAGANNPGSGLALPGLAGAAAGASSRAGNGGNAASAPRGAAAQSGAAAPSAGAAQSGGAAQQGMTSQSGAASQPGSATHPGASTPSASATQPGGIAQPGTPSQPGATSPSGTASQPGAATQPGVSSQPGASPQTGAALSSGAAAPNGNQAGANSAGSPGTDSAKPGISGDASTLGGTSGTGGTPGSSPSAAGGASAQTGGAGPGGAGISPSGTGSPASPYGTSGSPAQAGAAAESGPAITTAPGDAATDDAGAGAKAQDTVSGLPSWLSDNLLIILTAVLAVVAFVIAWLLRRAAVRRDEDQDDLDDELYMSEIDQSAIDRRLDGIDLDLDEPPAESDRPRPGPVRT